MKNNFCRIWFWIWLNFGFADFEDDRIYNEVGHASNCSYADSFDKPDNTSFVMFTFTVEPRLPGEEGANVMGFKRRLYSKH